MNAIMPIWRQIIFMSKSDNEGADSGMSQMKNVAKQASIPRRLVLGGLLGMATVGLRAQGVINSETLRSLIVPFPAGGITDSLARKMADWLSLKSSKTFLVDNVPGAGGVIAANNLLKRPRDGRTLLLANSGLIINTPLLSKLPLGFDPHNDVVPICTIVDVHFVVFSSKNYAANDLKELKQFAENNRDPLFFATQTAGATTHIAAEVLLQRLGIPGIHVPYKNTNQLIIDVAENRVPIGVVNWADLSAFLKAGKIKALCFLSDIPGQLAPDIPTVMSQGFGSFDIHGWFGLFFAKGVPDQIALEYEDQVKSLFKDKTFSEFLTGAGLVPAFRDHNVSKIFIDHQIQKYRQLFHNYHIA